MDLKLIFNYLFGFARKEKTIATIIRPIGKIVMELDEFVASKQDDAEKAKAAAAEATARATECLGAAKEADALAHRYRTLTTA